MSGADQVIRWSTAAAVIGDPVVTTVVSYEHAYALVHAHGKTGWTARPSRSRSTDSCRQTHLGKIDGHAWRLNWNMRARRWQRDGPSSSGNIRHSLSHPFTVRCRVVEPSTRPSSLTGRTTRTRVRVFRTCAAGARATIGRPGPDRG